MADQKFRVLIIEDSPTDQKALTFLLTKRLNCEVETALDGVEGLNKLSDQRYSVVFLDMLMPKMNGDDSEAIAAGPVPREAIRPDVVVAARVIAVLGQRDRRVGLPRQPERIRGRRRVGGEFGRRSARRERDRCEEPADTHRGSVA